MTPAPDRSGDATGDAVGDPPPAPSSTGAGPEPETLVFGVPVYFATTDDARAFVERFGPVAAVVEGDVFCHFA